MRSPTRNSGTGDCPSAQPRSFPTSGSLTIEAGVQGLRSRVAGPLSFSFAAFLLAASSAAGASRPEAEQARIDWLLAEIGNSNAIFVRNGKEYDASRAVSHLKTKLLFAGRRVQTARQFIVGIASRSSESGKPYEIRLPDGKQQAMEVWLLERLAVYEKGAAAMKPTPPPRE